MDAVSAALENSVGVAHVVLVQTEGWAAGQRLPQSGSEVKRNGNIITTAFEAAACGGRRLLTPSPVSAGQDWMDWAPLLTVSKPSLG